MQSDRRGQAQSALRAVEGRHKEIQKIEQQMVELAQLFQDLNEIVVQQEPLVENIEQKGEEVRDNVVKANEEIDTAIVSARSRNRKKWYCLGISSKCIFPTPACLFTAWPADHVGINVLIAATHSPHHHHHRRRRRHRRCHEPEEVK